MGKKLLAILLCIVAAFTFAGCSGSVDKNADNQETKIIRVAFNQNEEHPQYKAMKELGDKFEEATNGRYKMVIYPNGVLGEQGSMAEFIRTGALEMAIVPCSVPESYDSDFAIVGAPYLYQDMDHLRRATESGVFSELFHSTRKFNFEVLTIYTAGERNIYSDKPINSPDDLKGMIVRVNDSPTYLNMVKYMGGVGTVMSQSEVYTALQQGVIDAGENSERVYTDFKHYEVAPYYSYTKHIVHPDVVIASTNFLDNMSAEDRAIFDKLVLDSTNYEFDAFKESVEQGKKDAEAHGAKFVYPDVEAFREKCMPLLQSIADQSDVTKDIYNKVEALREEE
ncbi:MAG: TRAP transporter substrate-binding protein [Eubacterium sp.]|nr:TRAP transporter substrate-binding protein [Eubacterium sp.]